MTYGSAMSVAAFTPRFANASGRFDNTTVPTLAQVDEWRTQVSAMIDVALATAGLPTPGVGSILATMLDGFVNANVSSLVRAVNGQGRFAEKPAAPDEMLLSIQNAADLWVKSHAQGLAVLLGLDTQSGVGGGADSRLPRRADDYTGYTALTSDYAPVEVWPW